MWLDSLDDPGLSWRCMACGRIRPNVSVGVAHWRLKGFEGEFPHIRVNYRYCLDDPSCTKTGAQEGVWDGADGMALRPVPKQA